MISQQLEEEDKANKFFDFAFYEHPIKPAEEKPLKSPAATKPSKLPAIHAD